MQYEAGSHSMGAEGPVLMEIGKPVLRIESAIVNVFVRKIIA